MTEQKLKVCRVCKIEKSIEDFDPEVDSKVLEKSSDIRGELDHLMDCILNKSGLLESQAKEFANII